MGKSSWFGFPALAASALLVGCDAASQPSTNQPALMSVAAAASERQSAEPFKLAVAAPTSDDTAGEMRESRAELNCTPIQFQRGTTSAIVRGSVPPEDPDEGPPRPACYSLAVGEGQEAKIRLLAGENVGITIPEVGDMRDSLEFRTRRGTYRIELYQLFPTVEPAPFRIRV